MQTRLIQSSASNIPSVALAKLEAEFGIQNQGDGGTFGGSANPPAGAAAATSCPRSPPPRSRAPSNRAPSTSASMVFMSRHPPLKQPGELQHGLHAGGAAAANMIPGSSLSKTR